MFEESRPSESNQAGRWFESMTFKLMLWSKDILEVMFFVGLTGCVGVVIISWVSILKSAFSEKPED